MKYLILLILLLLPIMAYSQSITEEVSELKDLLSVAPTTKIQLANSQTLEKKETFKVFLAIGLDVKVRDNFLRWIDEWNNKDGKKYGLVQLITEVGNADIVLARYTHKENVSTASRSVELPSTIYNPGTGKFETKPATRTFSNSTVPVFAYIIKPSGQGFEILSRYVDQTSLSDTKDSGRQLWDNFKKMLKAQK